MSSPKCSQTLLLNAIKNDDYLKARYILNEHGLELNNKWLDYEMLIQALMLNSTNFTRLLLSHGCRVKRDTKTKRHCTPLHYAVVHENLEIIQELLEKGASITDKDMNTITPLFLAMKMEYFQAVDLMLSKYDTDNIDPTSNDAIIHFDIACLRNHVDLVKTFINKGINVNTHVDINDKFWPGYTPLHFAVEYQAVDVVEVLLRHGANVSFQSFVDLMTPVHLAFYCDKKLNDYSQLREKSRKIFVLLFGAQSFEKIENRFDVKGISHFHIACTRSDINPNIIEQFLDIACIDCCIPHYSPVLSGYTPLHIAVEYRCKRTVRVLLNHKPDVNIKNRESCTPLHLAVKNRDQEVIKLLVKYNPNLNIKNNDGSTPLHEAFDSDNIEATDLLLSAAERDLKNSVNQNGISHFHICASRNNIKIVKTFLQKGIDINSRVDHTSLAWPGFTALHFAVAFENLEMVKLLLKFKADVNAVDVRGYTPLIVACQQEFDWNDNFVSKALDQLSEEDLLGSDLTEKKLKTKFDNSEKIQIIKSLMEHNSNMNVKDASGVPLLFHAITSVKDEKLMNSIIKVVTEKKRKLVFSYVKKELVNLRRLIIQTLLDNNIDVNICNSERKSVLHFLIERDEVTEEKLRILELLVRKNINVNTRNKFGKTPLLCATENGSIGFVEILLKHKADPNLPTPKSLKTPLHLAATKAKVDQTGRGNEYSKIMDLLLTKGANVDVRDSSGCTPLFGTVCDRLSRKAMDCLLRLNCDVNIQNNSGKSALFYAVKDHNAVAIDALLRYGGDINITDNKNTCLLKYFNNMQRSEIFSDMQNRYLDSFKVLEFHIEKSKLIGYHVSAQNLQYCEKLKKLYYADYILPLMHLRNLDEEKYYDKFYDPSKDLLFKSMCKDELKKMKTVKIDFYTTLYDILMKDSRRMTKHVKNEAFKDYLELGNLKSKFSLYSFALYSKYREGMKRCNLIESAERSLQFLSGFSLPDSCCQSIFFCLDTSDLENLSKLIDLY